MRFCQEQRPTQPQDAAETNGAIHNAIAIRATEAENCDFPTSSESGPKAVRLSGRPPASFSQTGLRLDVSASSPLVMKASDNGTGVLQVTLHVSCCARRRHNMQARYILVTSQTQCA